jgi:phytol kinase
VLGALNLAVEAVPWPSLLAMAAAATALEQVAIYGLDNLTVPVGVAWLWHQLSHGL